jgi:hypothetical protein
MARKITKRFVKIKLELTASLLSLKSGIKDTVDLNNFQPFKAIVDGRKVAI